MKFHPKENAQEKSYKLALKIIAVCREIQNTRKEFVISKQLLRSGTSIGANLQEAVGRQSDKDLYYKVTIAYKESRETKYWMSLLYDSTYIGESDFKELDELNNELLRILGASLVTLKKKLKIK